VSRRGAKRYRSERRPAEPSAQSEVNRCLAGLGVLVAAFIAVWVVVGVTVAVFLDLFDPCPPSWQGKRYTGGFVGLNDFCNHVFDGVGFGLIVAVPLALLVLVVWMERRGVIPWKWKRSDFTPP